MRIPGLLGAAACAAMLFFLATEPVTHADIIGQTVAPGTEVVGTVSELHYDSSGQLVVAVIRDRRGRRFLVFDGAEDNDLEKFGAALTVAHTAKSKVTLTISSNDVTGMKVHRTRRASTVEVPAITR